MASPARRFPILDEELLMSLPKAQKQRDIDRMLTSHNSEDWVTWNLMRALARAPGEDWWPGVVSAAEADASRSFRWSVLEEAPDVDLWRTIQSPPAYETASRRRMAASDNAEWRKRTRIAKDVEGETEVDLVFDGDDYLVFVEAKLHSDVSPNTTYDPERNQIVRNIDCVIEQAGDRAAFFWMLVRDRSPERLYSQLVEQYRSDPSALHRLLPHRNPAVLGSIAEGLAVIEWRDLLPLIPDHGNVSGIAGEIERRVCAAA